MRVSSLVLLLAPLVSCHRPVPFSVPPGGSPYPLAVGARWSYRSPLGLKVVRECRRTTVRDGQTYFEMTYTLPLWGEEPLLLRPTAEGVMACRGTREQVILRFPMREGDQWGIDFPGEDVAECTVEGIEELEILGRRMPCRRLRAIRTSRGGIQKAVDREWYAEGLGLVRMRVTHLGLTQDFRLESYENGSSS